MSSDEFSDLQKFGKTIKLTPKIDTKKEEKNKNINSKKNRANTKLTSRKIIIFIIKIFKYFVKFVKLILKKLNKKYYKTKKRNIQKIAVFQKNNHHKIMDKTCYKIIEKKRQRRNKTIIIRRRVPVDFVSSNAQPKVNNLGALYYLSIKLDETGNQEFKTEKYCNIKKSVWDFPIEENRKWKKFF